MSNLRTACVVASCALIGCQGPITPDELVSTDAVSVTAEPEGALRSDLTLVTDGDLYWGHTVIYTVSGGAPGEIAYLLRSTNGVGPGPCPALFGGLCLDINGPVSLHDGAVVDAAGLAEIPFTLPASGPVGAELSTQAVIVRGVGGAQTIKSDVHSQVITEAPSGSLDAFIHVPDAVDLLFVVDNSCSMAEEQADLTASFPFMVDALLDSGLDYHAGVVSTDMVDPSHSGKLQDAGGYLWIDPLTLDPIGVFTSMASLGTAGHFDEAGRAAAYTALELLASSYNAGFRRDDAQLAIVVISDEDDKSTNSPISAAEFVTWLEDEAPNEGDVTFNSIVAPPGGCALAAEPGNGYIGVTDEVGGVLWSICDTGYAPALEAVADQLWSSDPYELSDPADPATIVVTATEPGEAPMELDATQYVYDALENTIRITSAYRPPADTVLEVAYEPL